MAEAHKLSDAFEMSARQNVHQSCARCEGAIWINESGVYRSLHLQMKPKVLHIIVKGMQPIWIATTLNRYRWFSIPHWTYYAHKCVFFPPTLYNNATNYCCCCHALRFLVRIFFFFAHFLNTFQLSRAFWIYFFSLIKIKLTK